jgi:hypothetical protein
MKLIQIRIADTLKALHALSKETKPEYVVQNSRTEVRLFVEDSKFKETMKKFEEEDVRITYHN